ncbi:hypothetical protein HY409_01010 [Candidatus Gottesmanbacteria bacterium]|nr:hypothetical protein [Candidatus Gottesmanbacteria bacterium]
MFQKARIKLTLWYLSIIILISVSFSIVIYKGFTHELTRIERIQRYRQESIEEFRHIRPLPYRIDPEVLEETRYRIRLILTLVNIGILLIAGGAGYFLAGKTLKPISEMLEEQNRFISDASHELRTPLTSLKSAFEVHVRNKDRNLEEADTLVTESILEVNKLQMLSESLLQLTKYQKQNGQTRFEKLLISHILVDAVSKIQSLAKKKKITIHYLPTNIQIYGDTYGLTDLFVILLDNAVKYSRMKGTIDIDIKKSDGQVIISIKDFGIGIGEKDLPHIFDRFYRADTARSKSKHKGFGLGLSIAQKIATLHNGFLRAQSFEGKGSTFSVYLPVKKIA